jgi:tetratricopeptide (TPR) repeat protein
VVIQVIAAAAMLACIECTRHTEAISAYDLFMSGNQHAASEWQWGGGNITAVKPLCRDLALHAMGKIESGGLSHDAMSLFGESINEGSPLSTSAVLGLALCLEYDGDWQSSIKYLKGFVEFAYRQNQSSWHVITDVMGRATGDNNGMALTPPEENNLLADLLASAMRVCNQQGQHGLGILLCSITNTSYIGELRMNVNNKVPCAEGEVVNAIASQPIISENKQVLEAFVHCLHGLGCGNVAEALLTTFQYDNSFPLPHGSRRSEATHAESWMHAYIAIDRVLKAMDAIRSSHDLPPEDRILLERGLSRAMSYCIDSNQPAAALELFHYASTVLEDRNRTLTERVRLFFGIDNSYGDNNISGATFHEGKEIDLTKLRLGDALLAAVIKSYNNLGESEKARSAFLDGTLNSDDTIPQSANNTLEALLDIDIDECIKFLDSMDMNYVNPTTFYLIARRYAQTGSWPEVGDIYNRARNAGCISEELGLIAMQAVVEAELSDGKITVLRRIIDDLCGLVGMESNYWIRSRYWGIKKRVGFHYARVSYGRCILCGL